jgi:hypothetical protein
LRDTQKLGVVIVGLLWVVGAATYSYIPFHAINGPGFSQLFGLDLLNVYLFHHCPEAIGNVYGVSGEVCGDPEGRPMLYPPLLYHLFGWVSFLSFPQVLFVWTATTLTLFLSAGVLFFYVLKNESLAMPPLYHYGLWLMLGVQFPMLFTLERATNDAYIFFLCIVGILLSQKSKWHWVGFILVCLTAYKIYPVFILILVLAASWGKPSFKKMLTAICLSGVVLFLLFFGEHLQYLELVLPQWANKKATFTVGLDHVILNMNHVVPYLGTAMCGALLLMGLSLARHQGPRLAVWCYAFAICTFFQNTSFDYNLITVYPLFMLLAAHCYVAQGGIQARKSWALLLSGVLIFFVARHLGTLYAGTLKYMAFWLWFMATGLALRDVPVGRELKAKNEDESVLTPTTEARKA